MADAGSIAMGIEWADTVLEIASTPFPYFAEAEGTWFGWREGHFEIRRPAFQIVASHPLTKRGWEGAWEALVTNYPSLGSAVAARLRYEKMSPSERAHQMAIENAARARRPQKVGEPLAKFSVQYLGGHPDIAKGSVLRLEVWQDRFHLSEAAQSAAGLSLSIPYSSVRGVDVVRKELGFARSILGGLNSRQLNQQTTLHIAFRAADLDLVLRLEMVAFTIPGAANKVRQFMDLLRTGGIVQRFESVAERPPSESVGGRKDLGPAAGLERLAALHADGTLTDDEFQALKRRVIPEL